MGGLAFACFRAYEIIWYGERGRVRWGSEIEHFFFFFHAREARHTIPGGYVFSYRDGEPTALSRAGCPFEHLTTCMHDMILSHTPSFSPYNQTTPSR